MALNKRGRPKTNWEPYEEELQRRLDVGEALSTVEQEATYLEQWGKANAALFSPQPPNQKAQIRNRINKRHNGAQGYKNARANGLLKLKKIL